ncbi:MAG: zf-HC2 domain-containing protein [Armatimonadota bacterium]
MHCEKSALLLPLLDEGTLDAFTAWRLRRHLAACPDCAADHTAFAGLDTRLRAADLAAPFATAVADRSPSPMSYTPARTAPSLVRRRLLLGAASAVSLAAVGAVGVTVFGPSKVAFAQVQKAMASIRTAEWTRTETRFYPWGADDKSRTGSVTIVSHFRARMDSPAILREAIRIDKNAGARERSTQLTTSLETPDGYQTYRPQIREIILTPMRSNGTTATRDTVAAHLRARILGRLTFTPPDAPSKNYVWETQKVTLDNKPALKFTTQTTFKQGKPGYEVCKLAFTVWADAETKRVLRSETEQRFATTGAMLERTVIDGIRCDISIPDSVFSLHAPAGTPVCHENYWWEHESSAKLTPGEKAQVNRLIDQTYAGILASDWKRASAGWDLRYAASLPGSLVPVGGLEKWLRGKVAEGKQYKMMRRQAVSGINDAPYVRVMGFGDASIPDGKPYLVTVTLTPSILRQDGLQEMGTETFYFRRDGAGGFRIVGWQYPERLRSYWRRQQMERRKGRTM